MLARPFIDPVGIVTYDWVHTFLQGGVFNSEVDNLLVAARPWGNTRIDVQDFLKSEWKLPSRTRFKQSQLHRVFDVRRVSENKNARRC